MGLHRGGTNIDEIISLIFLVHFTETVNELHTCLHILVPRGKS